MKTLLLDRTEWDLVLDTSGNIAVASNPYSLAQDAASAIRLFYGELWYDTQKGVPYWTQIFGKSPSLLLIKAKLEEAAMSVPGVTAARALISGYSSRQITGQIQITDATGATSIAAF